MPTSSSTPGKNNAYKRLERLIQPAKALAMGETGRKSQLAAFDQVMISAANFVGTILMARFVSPTELGIYTVGYLAIYLVRAIQEGLVVQPLNAIGAVLELEEFRRYISATGLFQIGLALATALTAAGLGWLLTSTGNDMAGPALFSLWFAFLAWQLQEFLRRIFYTRGEIWRAVLNTALSTVVRLTLVIWWGTRQDLTGIAGLNAIAWGGMAAFALGFWQARRIWTWHSLDLFSTWKLNWKFGRWILGGTVANWITLQLYPILAAGMISFAAAGAYQALQNLVAPVHVLLRAADTFMTPRIARVFHKSGYQSLTRTLRLTYLFAGLPVFSLLFVAVVFAGPLLHFIRDDTYLPYRQGIFIMAAFYALWYAYYPLQTAFKAVRLSRPIFIANLAAIGSMLTIGLWLIQRWGLYGTLAGQALNALIINLVLWFTWWKVIRKNSTAPSG